MQGTQKCSRTAFGREVARLVAKAIAGVEKDGYFTIPPDPRGIRFTVLTVADIGLREMDDGVFGKSFKQIMDESKNI